MLNVSFTPTVCQFVLLLVPPCALLVGCCGGIAVEWRGWWWDGGGVVCGWWRWLVGVVIVLGVVVLFWGWSLVRVLGRLSLGNGTPEFSEW